MAPKSPQSAYSPSVVNFHGISYLEVWYQVYRDIPSVANILEMNYLPFQNIAITSVGEMLVRSCNSSLSTVVAKAVKRQ